MDVERQVSTRTIDAGEVRVITIRRTYAGTVDDLWEACTNPERIPRWFLPVSGDLRLGGRYQLEGNAGGTVTECEPPHRFAATWEFGDQVTWIEVRVVDAADGHARFELDHLFPLDGHFEQFGPAAVGIGWDQAIVRGLSRHLDTGGQVDPAEAMAWMVSEEGLQFTRDAGAAWCEADIAGGEDPAVARERADRTVAAYTEPPEPAPED